MYRAPCLSSPSDKQAPQGIRFHCFTLVLAMLVSGKSLLPKLDLQIVNKHSCF